MCCRFRALSAPRRRVQYYTEMHTRKVSESSGDPISSITLHPPFSSPLLSKSIYFFFYYISYSYPSPATSTGNALVTPLKSQVSMGCSDRLYSGS
ncbi:hypothetical protein EVAR_92039_1 [Eumeta japonica]|uniref:Uncharacterized protein n=1 Tax=Eumeta variegata TaxID=151549 RepID=A0A4C1SXZ2_EUMVA|nr:hypothetical protein EVAR_92039_1 [Eumeta japonica]